MIRKSYKKKFGNFKLTFILISLILISTLNGCMGNEKEENNSLIIYVDNMGGEKADYKKIQNAINYSLNGTTIFVFNGIYNETLIIDKSIIIKGEDENKTFLVKNTNMKNTKTLINISSDNCQISNFTLNNNNLLKDIGITISSSDNIISNIVISNFVIGINILKNTKNNEIINNKLSANEIGINIEYKSEQNIIKQNLFDYNYYGIYFRTGSNKNIAQSNKISFNQYGIRLTGSTNNEIIRNNISNNTMGIYLCCGSMGNMIYLNNFEYNSEWNTNISDSLKNQWDNGIIGNYWDDYLVKYPNALIINNIWDTPYKLNEENMDNYPLSNKKK